MEKTLGIGLAGFGTVGTGVWETLERNLELILKRTGVEVEIKRIAVRDPKKARLKDVPTEAFTTDWLEVVNDPDVDIVVELIGGTTTAFDIVASALSAGKPVVTGNKALLAERGKELFSLSLEKDTPIHFEAAVAGGIPIIKTVQDSFVGNQIESMAGIINGTSNYILQRMTEAGLGYEEALGEAQQLGYAEADPTLDVNGWDAAHKAILLATLAYGFIIDPTKVYVRGIERVRSTDIEFAKRLGFVVKLLCVVREHEDGTIELRTQPSFIPGSHVLASVNGVFNAVAVIGDAAGESLFYGRGAGKDPTASSVVADIVEAARSVGEMKPGSHRGFLPYKDEGKIMDIEDTQTPYYVRFDVTDEPGVVAKIANELAIAGIGIAGTHSPVNADDPDADFVDMVFQLHTCRFGLLKDTLKKIEALSCVNARPVVFRIENLT
ncbi:homoserine dehydrogenase [Verrucomicrobiaceae bacterium R5-34]|uniref:Homoserine dehydrogenase n=1 Tax=Oceaniferula flava TaxID=2800421 RepID=A0AAE2V8U1_9BACT|nr:homoserine dehydrogenase [Oceaniferula flavus]MBK1831595.1 homoserine dehydrogenase [Verrucomicrobiaceae bacterium R5-34]MBK1854068.1 homoserine dehydrogenase [Oceaniferula flavus]MBM1135374.1 homoserine dehydrogenase [Oceaniferula flavus]